MFGYCVQYEFEETGEDGRGLITPVGNFRVWLLMLVMQGPRCFRSNFITLNDLKPLRVYCFQVKAELCLTKENISRPGLLSNMSCSETAADGNVRFFKCFLSWEQNTPKIVQSGIAYLVKGGECRETQRGQARTAVHSRYNEAAMESPEQELPDG